MRADKNHIHTLLSSIALNDDKKAFEELFELFYQQLYAFAYHFTRHKEQAEEIISDVFFSIWQKRKKLNQINNIHTYLYTAIKNQSLNYLNKEKNHHLSIEDFQESIYSPSTPEKELLLSELQDEIDAAIAQLPPQCKLVFQLIRENGLKYKEAADILGISTKTIEAQIGIALKKLSNTLKKHIPHHKSKAKVAKIGTASLIGLLILLLV